MSKNKLIFAIIGVGIVVVLLIFSLVAGSKNKSAVEKIKGGVTIWTVGDSSKKMIQFIKDFKSENIAYSNISFNVQSFHSYEEYTGAMHSAILKGKTPDIFVLNNNEKSLFEDLILPIPNSVINIREFKENHKLLFANEMVIDSGKKNKNDITIEYLKGVPIGYETLGILFNKRFRLYSKDFNTMSAVKSTIKHHVENEGIPLLGIGNGKNVIYAGDVLAQFFLLNGATTMEGVEDTQVRQSISEYSIFGNINGENKYNSLFQSKDDEYDEIDKNTTSLELFAEEKVGAIIAYPRTLEKLQEKGFSRKLLGAVSFPHSYSTDGPSLANYNYFVINSGSKQKKVSMSLLSYMASKKGAEEYLDKFRYYLPARISLEEDLAERRVSNYFKSVVLANFYSSEPLSSFNKANKVKYDKGIISVLDSSSEITSNFHAFNKKLICQTKKILTLKDLETPCK